MFASVLLLSLFRKALVFKRNVWSEKGCRTEAPSCFLSFEFCSNKDIFIQREEEWAYSCRFWRIFCKGDKANSFCSSWFISCFVSGLCGGDLSSLTCSSLPTAPDGPYGRDGRGRSAGRQAGRKRGQRHSRWMINAKKQKTKKKIPFTVRERRWTMSVIYRIKAAFTHTLRNTQSMQKTGTFLRHFFTRLNHFLYQGCDSRERKKNQQLKTYSTISKASPFPEIWQLYNQKRLHPTLSLSVFC